MRHISTNCGQYILSFMANFIFTETTNLYTISYVKAGCSIYKICIRTQISYIATL